MFLALDIGNSAVKGGLFNGPELVRVFSVAGEALEAGGQTPDEAWTGVFDSYLQDASIDGVGVASVVPSKTESLTGALSRRGTTSVTRVDPAMSLPFDLAYETPATLGADRLAAAAAGWIQVGASASPPRSVIVIDAGTALTCEVVHRDGVYQGGTITAGPALIQQALHTGTAQLPDAPLALPDGPVGRSTKTALQSGIMWGLVDGLRGMVRRLSGTLPDTPLTVLTGGWGNLLADHLDHINHHRPHAVLEGIRLLAIGADG